MRTAVTLLLALHGMIHLLGFVRWMDLAPVAQLGGRTLFPLSHGAGRVFGLVWLAAFLFMIAAAALRVMHHPAWWEVALAGVIVSQALIVIAWSDAKFGTIANVLLLVPIILAAAHDRFERRIDGEVDALRSEDLELYSRSHSRSLARFASTSAMRPMPSPPDVAPDA